MPRRALFISSLALGLVASTHPQEDPVLRARAQRASSQGISEGDLPPVPRGIVEPPPLPPPEAHVKDTPRGKKAKGRAKKGKAGAKKKGTAARSKKPAKGKGK
ncbi:hypothetical protein GETHLI_35420 [Geothrix limicola]|uniref:Uncharacterized protein n=1 Tax=Geothrix limicola TaxID=2927978 RepID=A0ABQ5QJH9_9BACT|nr:hypothetical protein [Geothrix limicola]GLH75039.1 hypothetical protein GETHLI_35420 [Geothrix limicola]